MNLSANLCAQWVQSLYRFTFEPYEISHVLWLVHYMHKSNDNQLTHFPSILLKKTVMYPRLQFCKKSFWKNSWNHNDSEIMKWLHNSFDLIVAGPCPESACMKRFVGCPFSELYVIILRSKTLLFMAWHFWPHLPYSTFSQNNFIKIKRIKMGILGGISKLFWVTFNFKSIGQRFWMSNEICKWPLLTRVWPCKPWNLCLIRIYFTRWND